VNPANVEVILAVLGIVQSLVVIAVPIIATWLGNRIADGVERRTGIEVEAKHRQALHSALETAINLGLNKVQQRGRAAYGGGALLQDSLEYIHRSTPDAIAHFGVSDRMLAQMLQSKLSAAVADRAKSKT
jgi:hypothetical protein